MSRAALVLVNDTLRAKAAMWCREAPAGTRVEFKGPRRSNDQNALMWALLTDVATQSTHCGLKLSADDWKALFVNALGRETRMVPNLDNDGFVTLGRSTSDLSTKEFSDLIEIIYAYGAKAGVIFHEEPQTC